MRAFPKVGMSEPSYLERFFVHSLDEFVELAPEVRAQSVRSVVPDLNFFLDEDRALGDRDAPPRTRTLARSLFEALAKVATPDGARTLRERVITNALLRSEADRDQNVYLGRLFTRSLTHAVPDVILQPMTSAETAAALRWAREHKVPVTLRGAATTAMGGAVPNDAGLVLDLSRLDSVEIDAAAGVCVLGAGARLRTVHAALAARGLALRAYPSNLGGTFAGWFATGGIGLNAGLAGRALDNVRAADVLLPGGDHVRFHDDGRIDVPEGNTRVTVTAEDAARWFHRRGSKPMALADLAGSEGALGAILHLTVRIEARPEIAPFLLAFEREQDAVDAAEWVARLELPARPANVKFLSGTHVHHTLRVWDDEAARVWKRHPGTGSNDAALPWTRIVGPAEIGAVCTPMTAHPGACLFVDFFDLRAAREFAARIAACPGAPTLLEDSVRFAAERFRPQQTKRFGPGLLAAEIFLPAPEVKRFLPRAAALARRAGSALDAEVYFLADGSALVIAGYLTDHRSGAFAVDLMLAPALLDLAMTDHQGRPYVLGRWQSAWFENKFGPAAADRLRGFKRALDPDAILNRGVLLEPRLHGVLGAIVAAAFAPGVGIVRHVFQLPALAWMARGARSVLRGMSGPAHGHGEPAAPGARFRVAAPEATRSSKARAGESRAAADETPIMLAVPPSAVAAGAGTAGGSSGHEPQTASHGHGADRAAEFDHPPVQRPEDRALHCVNCGECNSVCPVFQDSKIRLPQMLTHLGESMRAGEKLGATGGTLLDLCMRCGNCEQVCQAGIPHLPLYDEMQRSADRVHPHDDERHTVIVAAVRSSPHYLREFLGVRPGGYQKRAPVALPGLTRFVVLRSENDAGPAATCIHCGACVPVCPTHANREFQGADARWITTVQNRCIGCGACVEVCPNNHQNGGQTLRVMEAPTPDWFAAIAGFRGGREGAGDIPGSGSPPRASATSMTRTPEADSPLPVATQVHRASRG